MTRLVTGDAFKTALLITAFWAVFDIAEFAFGESLATPAHRVASLGSSFFVLWALTSLWGLVREWRSSRALRDGKQTAPHLGVANSAKG